MKLLGKPIAQEWKSELQSQIRLLPSPPVIHIVLVGNDPASAVYVSKKKSLAAELGVQVKILEFENSATTAELVEAIQSAASASDGIIVQLPLPKKIDTQAILDAVPTELDIDALSSSSMKRLRDNTIHALMPATPRAILRMLASVADIKGKKTTIVGPGILVGKPLSYALSNLGAHVSIVDIDTPKPTELTRQADIIISCVGKPGLITAEHVKAGQIVIDAGFSFVDGKVCGDVALDEVEPVVKYVSPVPGGVGAVTVVALFANVLDAIALRENDRQ